VATEGGAWACRAGAVYVAWRAAAAMDARARPAQRSRCSTYTAAAATTISIVSGWCGRNSIATGRVPSCAFLLVTACNVLVLVFFFAWAFLCFRNTRTLRSVAAQKYALQFNFILKN